MPKKLNGGEGIVWPDGKRLAVMVTFDFDAESLQLARFKGKELYFADRSRGEYGPDEGLKRCLDLLDRQGVESTFFIPGYVMEKYPEHVREIGRRGHDICTRRCWGFLGRKKRQTWRAARPCCWNLLERNFVGTVLLEALCRNTP